MAESSPEKETKAKPVTKRAPATHPTFLEMSMEAVRATTDHKGASVPAIRNYITETYKTVDPSVVKFRLKQALTRALEKEMLVKSKNSEDRPLMSSRFRINKAKTAASKPKKEDKKVIKKSPKKTTKEKPAKKAAEGKLTKAKAAKSPKSKDTKKAVKKVTTNREKTTKPKKNAKAEKPKAPKPKVPKTPKTPKSAKKIKKGK